MNKQTRWLVIVTIAAFCISIIMSLFSTMALKSVPLLIAILITLAFIVIGIIFDTIGVAVTSGDITVFNSMSARKIKSGKIGVFLVKNASKVSSICCDVIGDVCGIVSGACGTVIVTIIVSKTDANLLLVTCLVSAIISALTIGGKAAEKSFAMKESTKIIKIVASCLAVFKRKWFKSIINMY